MLAYLNGSRLHDASRLGPDSKNMLCIAGKHEQDTFLPAVFPTHTKASAKETAGNYCESHLEFDYIRISTPHEPEEDRPTDITEVFFSGDKLVFLFHCEKAMTDFLQTLQTADKTDCTTPADVLYTFLVSLTAQEADRLADLEQGIMEMEDSLVDAVDNRRDYHTPIHTMRRRLFMLKRYYESMVDLLDDLEENRNHFLPDTTLTLLHFHANKVDRLYHEVLNLRDYAMQVREAYQAQIDISLNNIMRVFTVVATIFLPLSLFVGWYGMNVEMPELRSKLFYPVFIAVSIAMVVVTVIFFKKKKWL